MPNDPPQPTPREEELLQRITHLHAALISIRAKPTTGAAWSVANDALLWLEAQNAQDILEGKAD